METVGRNRKKTQHSPGLYLAFRQIRGWAYQMISHRIRRLYASLSELLYAHTHHNIQRDWVKAEHTFMAWYFLVDFILNSELTIWELHINNNFSLYSFLIFQVVQMSGKMEKTQLCTQLETHLKHYILNINSSKFIQNSTWFGKTGYFLTNYTF